MAYRLYLIPIIGVGTRADPRRAKYSDTIFQSFQWGMMDFGKEAAALVLIHDIDAVTHATLAGQSDVTAVPENLDSQVGAQLAAVQNKLESYNIPADWVQETHTYRQIVRMVAASFQVFQRLDGIGVEQVFGGGRTLDTQYKNLPNGVKSGLQQVASDWNWDISSLGPNSTVRQIIKFMADQWGFWQLFLSGVEI